MRTIELYRKHKAGEVSREKFLYEVRRDKNLPWVTNVTSYDDAVKILKNKGVISEAQISKSNEAAGDVDTEATYDITLKNGEVIKNVKAINYKDWELETPTSYRQGQWSDVKSFEKSKSVNEETDQERDARRKEGDKEMDQTLLTFLKNLNAKSPTDHIAQKIKDQEAEMIKNYGSLNEVDNNIPTDPAVDRVNPYFLKKGVEMLLAKEKELTNDSYIKALNKAASMLEKNPHAFDEEMFANAKDVEKADAKLETEEVKKANHKNKANEMKKVKVKSLKESAIEELTTHLKKKELVNEDSHWKHNVGSEVHTPDGPGKVIEIVGGTFTVEMEDGTHKDFQFNTVDHFTQKAAEEEPSQGAQDEPSLSGMWKKWDQDVASGKYPDMNQQYGQELRYKPEDIQTLLAKLKEYISKNKDDKEKMVKIKEAVKKLKEAGEKTALVTTASGQTTAVDYKTDDELKSIGDNTDVRKVQTGMGKKVKG